MTNLAKRRDRGYTVIELIISLCGVVTVLGVIVAICVAAHFIAKLW